MQNRNNEELENQTIFLNAIKNGYIARVEQKLADNLIKVDVDAPDNLGKPPIYYAVMNNNEEIIKLLHQYKCNMNPVGIDFAEIICEKYIRTDEFKAEKNPFKLLKELGAKIDLEKNLLKALNIRSQLKKPLETNSGWINKNIMDNLMVKDRAEHFIKWLLEVGADINIKDEDGNTFLQTATESNNLDLMSSLIEYDADIHALNKTLQTPLHIAAASGYFEAFNILLDNKACTSLKDIDGKIALELAIENKRDKFIHQLFNEKIISAEQIVNWATKCERYSLADNYSPKNSLNKTFYSKMKALAELYEQQDQHPSIYNFKQTIYNYIFNEDSLYNYIHPTTSLSYITTSDIYKFMKNLAKKLFSENISYKQIVKDGDFNSILTELKKELNIDFKHMWFKLYYEKNKLHFEKHKSYIEKNDLSFPKPGFNDIDFSQSNTITFEDDEKNKKTIITKFNIFNEIIDLSKEQKNHEEYENEYFPLEIEEYKFK